MVDKEEAHQGLVADPSAIEGGVCADCHSDVVETFITSLHYTTVGQALGLEGLSHQGAVLGDEHLRVDHLAETYEGECSNCHATCGQCHISRANTVTGGLLDGHNIVSQPDAETACYSCHGSRSAGEYIGDVAGLKTMPDTHWKKAGMQCVDCHPVSNFHGTGGEETAKYKLAELPQCVDCHADALPGKGDVLAHNAHPENTLECQVCHSVPYNNCWDCHVTLTPEGKYGSKSDNKLDFKIALNPEQDERYPWKYVLVRHVPTARDMLAAKSEGLLTNFDQVPNYKLTTPHNIQKLTPQNFKCQNCHNNKKFFLTEDDIKETDPAANYDYVVKELPPKM